MTNFFKGSVGCLGIFILFALFFGGCSPLINNKENDEDEQKKYEKQEKSPKSEKSLEEEIDKQVTKELKDLDKKAVGSDNNVYGKYNDYNAEFISESMYYDKKNKIRYLHDNDYIFQIEKGFDTKLGINVDLDLDFILDHAKDYMEKDAEKVSSTNDHEFIYHSNKINKDYYVTISVLENNTVDRVIISSNK